MASGCELMLFAVPDDCVHYWRDRLRAGWAGQPGAVWGSSRATTAARLATPTLMAWGPCSRRRAPWPRRFSTATLRIAWEAVGRHFMFVFVLNLRKPSTVHTTPCRHEQIVLACATVYGKGGGGSRRPVWNPGVRGPPLPQHSQKWASGCGGVEESSCIIACTEANPRLGGCQPELRPAPMPKLSRLGDHTSN